MNTQRRKICPACGANCDASLESCWLCFTAFPAVASEAVEAGRADDRQPAASVSPARRNPSSGSYGIMSLLMVITLIAVCFGAFTVAPGLGILVSILATPALIRTVFVSLVKQDAGVEVSPADKVLMFAASVGALITAMIVAVAVFFGTCVAACFGAVALDSAGISGDAAGVLFMVLLVGGGILGIVMGIVTLRRLWSKQ